MALLSAATTHADEGEWSKVDVLSKVGDAAVIEGSATITGFTGVAVSASVGKMTISCVGNETKVYFSYDDPKVSFSHSSTLQYRLDLGITKHPFTLLKTTVSDDQINIGMWRGTGIPFLQHLKTAVAALEIQIADKDNNKNIRMLFAPTKTIEALSPIAAKCNWRL